LTLKAVLFDAGNTLLFLDYPRMAQSVGAALGLPLTGEGLAAGAGEATRSMERFRGADRDRAAVFLETLFGLAGVPAARLGEVRECLSRMHREGHLWSGVAPDTVAALDRLRAARLKLGVVSNSDGRVLGALQAAGLTDYFDVVVDSALVGVEKPNPAIFRPALEALGVSPAEAVYVGDLYEVDVVGARAAGLEAVLLVSDGDRESAPCRAVASLSALADLLLQGDF